MRKFIDIITEAEGKPYRATLYHGTTQTFDAFDHDLVTSHGPFGNGIYLTNDKALARQYADGATPLRVRVTLKRPYLLDSEDREARRPFRSSQGKQKLLDDGYDGVVFTEGRYVEVVAYRGAKLEILPQSVRENVEDSRSFTNELGHRIEARITVFDDERKEPVRIELIGPDSTSEDNITKKEAEVLRDLLDDNL